MYFRDASISNRRKLYEYFAGCVPTFNVFCSLKDSLGKYECLILFAKADEVKFDEQIMSWKSQLRRPFRFACDDLETR